ncbi:MAG: diacylglycerol kinase family protein [Longimicrobiales bacterium]
MNRTGIPLFVNPQAGTGPTGVDALRELFGADVVAPEVVQPPELAARIKRAVKEGHEIIAVAGGDGSLRAAVNAIAGTTSSLAIVPAGTLNNFARRIGIDDLETARDAMVNGVAEPLSLGKVGDELFLNTLTFGEYARTVRIREKLRGFLTKWPAALVGFLTIVLTLRTFDVELEVEGKRVKRRTPFLWVGIGYGSFPRVDEASERRDSPDLEVAILHSRTPLATAGFMWRASMQMLRNEYPVRDKALEVFHTRSLTLHTERAFDGTSDGELVRPPSPVHICVHDDAVRIFRPTRSADEGNATS